MQVQPQEETSGSPSDRSLETADAVARAAHIWVRSLCLTELEEASERHSMACGLITGLCERLELDPRVQELVAYVYALLDDEGTRSLAASRIMLHQQITAPNLPSYRRGQSEAAAIVEMLAFHKRRN